MGVESLSSKDDLSYEDNREESTSSNGIDDLSVNRVFSLVEAERFCRQISLGHYENFVVASVFLPKPMRQPFYNVYAFCRTADDIADLSPSPEVATSKLHHWQKQLQDCFVGKASEPVFIALRDTATRFDLSMEPFADLLHAFSQDQSKVRYESFEELLQYCRYSANPVGRMVLRLAKADSEENVKLSDSICTGLQLANHWQDVTRDFEAGRLYLPMSDLRRFDLDAETFMLAGQRDRFRKLLRFQCDRAADYLRNGLPLADQVPRWLANDLRLFVHGGLATLDAIAKIDYDVLRQRPTVSKLRQMRLMFAAFLGCL